MITFPLISFIFLIADSINPRAVSGSTPAFAASASISGSLPALINPSKLFELQKKYFENIGTNLEFGRHHQGSTDLDFVKEIKEAGFSNIGSFKLIDRDFYGEEFTCYIPENESDQNFKILKNLASQQKDAFKKSIQEGMLMKAKIKDLLT